ncbi:MAG: hemin uptake protein HemP [Pseudomonadota bacterium]
MQTQTRPIIHLPKPRLLPQVAASAETRLAPVGSTLRSLESASLLSGGKVVEIRHHDSVYRLSATRQGKLILTK